MRLKVTLLIICLVCIPCGLSVAQMSSDKEALEKWEDVYEWQLREYPNVHRNYTTSREEYNEALAEKHLKLKNTKKRLLKENTMLKTDISEQKSLLHLQEKRITELQKFNETLRFEWEELDKVNREKSAEKEQLIQDNALKEAEIAEQKDKTVTLTEESEILKEQYSLKESEYNELNAFYEEKEIEVAQLQEILDQKQVEVDNLKETNDNLIAEYDRRQQEFKELEELFQRQKEENERMEQELDSDLEAFYNKLLGFYEKEGQELRNKLEDYKMRKTDVQERLENE